MRVYGFTLLVACFCMGCSHGSSSRLSEPPIIYPELSKVSATPDLTVTITPDSSQNLAEQFQQISQNCDADFEKTPTYDLNSSSTITERDDTLHTGGNGSIHGDVEEVVTQVEQIIDANHFTTQVEARYERYSVTSLFQNTLYADSATGQLVNIISTQPSFLKTVIQNTMASGENKRQKTYSNCSFALPATINAPPDLYQSAVLTLQDGQKVHGVFHKSVLNLKNYTCRDYRASDNKLLAQKIIAPSASKIILEFEATDFTNPFAVCAERHEPFHSEYIVQAKINAKLKVGPGPKLLDVQKSEVLEVH